ncbi:MAG TPA: nuclease-related domain-containing protein [Gaiellaceae bacterium]|nr:nuclease-related domain-containing protein [Gaiellaceae bacterium]
MAYDVESEAGAYLLDHAGRRSQGFWLLLMAAYGIGAAGAVWAIMSAQLFPAVILLCAAVCSAAAARDMTFAVVPVLKGLKATQGDVRWELDRLRLEDYIVLHDVTYGGNERVDHLVSGANGVFLIEASFERYEREDLEKAKRQARELSTELGCWVSPVICAGEREKAYEHDGVLITGRGLVAAEIRAKVRGARVDPDRMRDFAARLN